MWTFSATNFPLNNALAVFPEILVCCVLVLIDLKELIYFCLNFVMNPVIIQEQVVHFTCSDVVLNEFNPEF